MTPTDAQATRPRTTFPRIKHIDVGLRSRLLAASSAIVSSGALIGAIWLAEHHLASEIATIRTLPIVFAALAITVTIAAGWPGLLSLPTQRGSTSMIALAGSVLAVVVGFTSSTRGDYWMAPILALAMIVTFWQQLLRRDDRVRLVESVTGVLCAVAVVAFASGWVGSIHDPEGFDTALISALSLSVAAAISVAPGRWRVILSSSWLGGTAIGSAFGIWLGWSALIVIPASALSAMTASGLIFVLRALPAASTRSGAVTSGVAAASAVGGVVYLVWRLA